MQTVSFSGCRQRERSVGRESPSPNGRRQLRFGALGGHGHRRKPKAWGGGERAELLEERVFLFYFIWGLKG
jgi:hypothetical protein